MESTMGTLSHYIMFYGFKIVAAIVIFVLGKWAAGLLRKLICRLLNKRSADPAIENFVSSLTYYAILAFVIIAALSQLGVQTASFVAVVAAAGLAIGLALQGSLANFAAGFLILVFRPFRIGDFVEMAGTAGVVANIHIFTTELKTPDNKKVIIPNSGVIGGNIVNYSANDTRRVDLVMGISYDDDIDKARRILEEVVNADERILKDPAPVIAVSQLADSSVNFVVRPWVKTADYWNVYFGLTETIKKRFDAEDVTIPYPQRDVHIHNSTEG